jgi:demethylmenaquinone methyltransferase/2-methoxy-6-polyprenyl-1,4-benzoquinol methylase
MTAIDRLFNRIAPVYDRLNDQLSLGSHRVWKKIALNLADPQLGGIWLDVCCGSGDMAGLLAQRVGAGGRVYGLDFAQGLLDIARRKFSPSLPITWLYGSALDLPFANASLDGCTLAYGLRNVGDVDRCLREIYRVLQPNGTAVVLDFHLPYNPLLCQFQEFYLNNVVVPIASQYDLGDEYAYILPSVRRFPQGRQQEQLGQAIGFRYTYHHPIAGGMMGILLLRK